MSASDRNKIEVRPSTLNNLVVAVEQGDYRVPQFQREYVWERTKVIDLFDSIYKEYPIGSFFLWKAERKHNNLFRHSIDLKIPPINDDDDVSFILDGQQRITSLYVTLKGMTASNTDYGRICFDVKDEKFTYREADNKRFFRVADIYGEDSFKIGKKVEEPFSEAFGRCFKILRTYPISIVEVRDQDLPAVCRIFQRINQGGKRLDRFDLIAAMTFTLDFDLREKFKDDIIARLKDKKFGEISATIVTQLMALFKKGACTERVEYSLTSSEISEMWKRVVDAIMLAAETLRRNVGVQNSQYLPYDALLTLLAYFYMKSDKRSLTEEQLAWVKQWFWRATFSQHYGSGGPTKMGRDKELFDALIAGNYPAFDPAMNLTAESLAGTKMTWSGSAIRNGFLCLLAQRDPLHLVNNGRLDLINGGISDFTSPEKHHVFPQAFLRDNMAGQAEVHALPNFCFLPAELNKRILDNRPSKYFPELKKDNSNFASAAQTHLLPISVDAGLWDDNYLAFLKARSQMILEEIERLTGRTTTPPADQRQKTIERMESRLRDVIHSTLVDKCGQSYWKVAVPNDVREEAERRILLALKKQPELTAAHFSDPREKINFCNVPDYVKLIMMNTNWSAFEPIFRRKTDVERHFEAFSEFRNAVMHGRTLTELTRRAGELAMIWFETIIAQEDDDSSEEELESSEA
jgi:hypothetical protein